MAEILRLGEVVVEGNTVSVRIKYKPWGSQKLVRDWFVFGDEPLDPEIYGIQRVDNRALPRALNIIARFRNRYPGSQVEEQRLDSVRAKISSIIESGKIWPEDF